MHAAAVDVLGLFRRIEHLQRHAIAGIHERGIAHQRVPAAAEFHHFLEVAEGPAGKPLALGHRGLVLQHGLDLVAQRVLQLGEVAAEGELPAVLVDDEVIHRQVGRRRVGPERIQRHVHV